jgi:hypothetical protein
MLEFLTLYHMGVMWFRVGILCLQCGMLVFVLTPCWVNILLHIEFHEQRIDEQDQAGQEPKELNHLRTVEVSL